MSRIVLHLDDARGGRWTVQRDDGSWSEPVAGTLEEAASQMDQQPVDVLVPSGEVLLTEVTIAARQQRRLLQALPFAVEEQLAGEVSNYHVCVGNQLGDHRYLAAAVDRQIMAAWVTALHDAGIEVRSMLPAVLALPLESGAATLVIDGDDALLRVSPARGYQLKVDEIDAYLELEEHIGQLLLLDPDQRWQSTGDTVIRQIPRRESLLQLLASGLADKPPVNLMQGDYQTRGQVAARTFRLWRWVAVLAVVAVGLEATDRGLELHRQTLQLEAMRTESENLLTTAFPDIGRVVDARSQMQQKLDALRGASGASGQGGFLYLLRAAGPTLLRESSLTIRSASYRSGSLLVELHAPDLATIERVRQQLMATLDVELESAATLADGADARLRVDGRAG